MTALTTLTRQLGRLAIARPVAFEATAYQAWLATPASTARCFASNKGGKSNTKKPDKRIHRQPPTKDRRAVPDHHGNNAALQHQEWVKFQHSIAVSGFETGQTMVAKAIHKTRGGRQTKRRDAQQEALAQKEAEQKRLTDVGGGLFPPLRYSDEETERLLAQAYASLPPRAGKRGTRNLKRQANRWHKVRQIRKKYKYHLAHHQERKMQARSDKAAAVKQVLADAPALVQRDRQYQLAILQRWLATMHPTATEAAASVSIDKKSSV